MVRESSSEKYHGVYSSSDVWLNMHTANIGRWIRVPNLPLANKEAWLIHF